MENRCLKCGTLLVRGAMEGHCRRCLAGVAFTEEEPAGIAPAGGVVLQRLGRYELLEEIGHGGMGVVYRARQPGLNREVAIKVLRQGPFADASEIERFRREAAAAARLRHPHIVTVFEEGEEGGHAYFSMELVRGRTLAHITQEGPIDPMRATRYAIAIANAVAHAHTQKVLHRDLKPANVIIDEEDQARITDFGLAKRLDLEDVTLTQGIIGSPGYMSPEQADPQRGPVGIQSDIYSFGALLYQLLTGRPPFAGASVASTLAQVLNNEPVPPRQFNTAVPLDLETICLKCLEKNPGERYTTAGAIAADLQRFLNGHPITARPISRTERFWRWCRRQPVVASLSGGVFMLLLLVAIGSSIAVVRIGQARLAEHEERQRAVEAGRQLETLNAKLSETVRSLELQRVEDSFLSGNSPTAIAQLAEIVRRDPSNRVAASRLVSGLIHRNTAIMAMPPLEHASRVAAMDLKYDGTDLVTAAGDAAQLWHLSTGMREGRTMNHSATIVTVRFSPDGTIIATGVEDGAVQLWDGVTGEPLATPTRHRGAISDICFDSSSSRLASASEDGTVHVWSVRENRLLQDLRATDPGVTRIRFSPDESKLLVGGTSGKITLWNSHGGRLVWKKRAHQDRITEAKFSRDGTRILTASRDSTARLWRTLDGEALTPPLRETGWVLCAEFSPDEKMILTGGQNGEVRLWGAEDGRPTGLVLRHEGAASSATFGMGGKLIASTSLDVTARIWVPSTGQLSCQPLWHEEMVTQALLTAGDSRFLTASADSLVRIWDIQERLCLPLVALENQHVHNMDISPDGKLFMAATAGAEVWIGRTDNAQPLGAPLGFALHATAVAFSPDGVNIAAAGGREAQIQVWDLASRVPRFTPPPHHKDFIRQIRFSPDGRRIASASQDHTARVWDVATGSPVTPPLTHAQAVLWVEFSPDGAWIATASEDHTARIWKAETGQLVTEPLQHLDHVRHLAFSPDSSRLVTASTDNHARIWDVRTGRLTGPPLTHSRIVNTARFSPDGRRIITASIDNTARVWDAHSGLALLPPLRHGSFVQDACFSPDGSRMVTVCGQGTARIWDADTGRPLTESLGSENPRDAYLVRFATGGRRIVAAKAGLGLAIWDFPPAPTPVPEWFAELAETLAGLHVSPQSNLETTPRTAFFRWNGKTSFGSNPDYYSKVARWMLGDRDTRPRSPFSEELPK